MLNLENLDKQKLINTPNFQVKDNTLWFKDYFLQVSNISQVSAREVQQPSYMPIAASLVVLGLLLMMLRIYFVGFILALAGGTVGYFWYKQKKKEPEFDLFITLNSGNVFRFHCKTQRFATRVMDALRECINMPNASISVDFTNSHISGNIAVGENNMICH